MSFKERLQRFTQHQVALVAVEGDVVVGDHARHEVWPAWWQEACFRNEVSVRP